MRSAFIAAMLIAAAAALLLMLVVQPFVTPIASNAPPVDPARLEAHVRRLSVDFHPRSHDQPGNLERAARYIASEFAAAGADVSVQDFPVGDATYRNVIARFGPPAGPLLIVGAHYDSHADVIAAPGHPRGFVPGMHTPGADDNASGVAGLLELARLLAREPQPRAIELVAYTLEEAPHFGTGDMGSVRHARSLAASKREVRLMLSLEMIGFFSDARGSQGYPLPGMAPLYSDRGDFIALVGKFGRFGATRRAKALMAGATGLAVHSINAPPVLVGVDWSDHRSYWSEGFAALMVTDTAFYRNRHWHQPGDRHDTLDYRRMAMVVQAVYALAQRY